MDAAAWGFVGTIVGAVVGASASTATTVLTARNAVRLQRDADTQERLERFRAFQRDNLLAVQEALDDRIQLMGREMLDHMNTQRDTGSWGELASQNTSGGISRANSRLGLLIERVQHDELRSALKDVVDKCNRLGLASDRKEAEDVFTAIAVAKGRTTELLGDVLRGLY